jgi:hypothetical protein
MTTTVRRIPQISLLALIVCAAPACAAPAPVDTLLTKALARPTASLETDYRFERTTNVSATDDPPGILVESYDPTRPADQKWKTISNTIGGSGKAHINIGDTKNKGKRDGNIMDYSELKELVTDSTVTLLDQTNDVARYSIKSKPGREIKLGDIKMEFDATEKGMTGELYVRKTGLHAPYISGVKMGLVEPIDAVVLKIKKLGFGYGFVPDAKSGAMMMRAFGLEMNMRAAIVAKINISVAINNAKFERVAVK